MSGSVDGSADGRIGVLLINLGTPDAATPAAVRRYLAEFLSDRRVVEIPPLIWQPILRGIILNVRPRKSAEAYRQVWTADGSPLAAITRAQTEALQSHLGAEISVDYAMRYGRPAISERIAALKDRGCDRILIAPLYPQYCGATTASVNDKAFAAIAALRSQPAIRTLPPYYDRTPYIAALAQSIRDGLGTLPFEPDAIVASFHGMPERTRALGDPYHDQCQRTAELLSAMLGRPLTVAFQSRFGRAKWLQPATDATLVRLAREGKTKVAVIAPGFAADCLETLEELALRGRDDFLRAGGEAFTYIPCLNDGERGIAMLSTLIAEQLEGWRNHD